MRTPFRLGTTSYILADAMLPNVRFLADKVWDVELLFFEVDEAKNALPNPKVFTELEALARAHDLTYTVHLPLALRLGEAGAQAEVALVRSERVIEATHLLDPFAYVVHLGSAPVPGRGGMGRACGVGSHPPGCPGGRAGSACRRELRRHSTRYGRGVGPRPRQSLRRRRTPLGRGGRSDITTRAGSVPIAPGPSARRRPAGPPIAGLPSARRTSARAPLAAPKRVRRGRHAGGLQPGRLPEFVSRRA